MVNFDCDNWARQQNATAGQWIQQQTQKCAQTKDKGYNQCTQTADEGYNQCSQTADEGYNQCCTWIPCSWFCNAWVWISNVVCVAWTWISNVVCVAWTWISNVVCILWTTVVSWVWKAGVAMVRVVCNIVQYIANVIDPPPLYPGDDTLPDLSNATFDHDDNNGNHVKFLWGVATASYQVEGVLPPNGDNANDWSIFANSKHVVDRVFMLAQKEGVSNIQLENPGNGVGHWDLNEFEQDVLLAKSLGITAYRLSLEWSRIQPSSARFDPDDNKVNPLVGVDLDTIDHYNQMLDILIQNGMTPILTLNHMTLPRWVLTPPTTGLLIPTSDWEFLELATISDSPISDEGFNHSLQGWENPLTIDAFVRFVQLVVPYFKNKVGFWITINEPAGSMVGMGYLAGLWSPGFVSANNRAKKAIINLVDAHCRAYDVIKKLAGNDAKVGFAHAMVFPKVAPAINLLGSNDQASKQWDYWVNRYFLEAVVNGIDNQDLTRKNVNLKIRDDWKGRLDFVGLNYYRCAYEYHNAAASLLVPWIGSVDDLSTKYPNVQNDLGWYIYPGGLYRFLKYLDETFHLPILVTENGLAEEKDTLQDPGKRAPYIVAHLSQVLHAIKEGVNVLGYVHWSIVDNWEWSSDYLPKARFGLYSVDLNNQAVGPLPRNKTQGAAALQYIIGLGTIGEAATKFGTITPAGDAINPPS